MSLKERFDQILKESLKSGDHTKVSTVRLLRSTIKNREIEKRGELTEEEILGLISSAVKQRKDSIEQFSKGGRGDLVQKETQEMEFLMSFLPQPLSLEDLEREIGDAIQSSKASGPQDVGKVMKILMPRIKGRADGSLVQNRVKERLQNR
jgi:uncharacterized protein YqeY